MQPLPWSVPCGQARAAQPALELRAEQQVARALTALIAAGDDPAAAAQGLQRRHGGEQVAVAGKGGQIEQPGGLAAVRRADRGQRQQLAAQRAAQLGIGQAAAVAAGAPDGVDHQRHGRLLAQALEPARQHAHVGGAAQHAGLDGGRRQIGRQRGELGIEQVWVHRLHALHGHGVLRGQRGQRRAAVHAQGVEGAQIGGDAGAAAAVASGHAPDDGAGFESGVHAARSQTGVEGMARSCGAISPAS
ncbi:MAG: hypothetical protein U1E77_11785 [Inhella sp.]